ncbi:MAG: 6-carboxytetrahydropterin synthase [Pseudomonadota bacterium]|nr:6-carboxytetrahydropterin synthase [Pseudomonadota bacterium]
MDKDRKKISKEKIKRKHPITDQEHSFKSYTPIDKIINNKDIKFNEIKDSLNSQEINKLNSNQINILSALNNLDLLKEDNGCVYLKEDIRKIEYLLWIEKQMSDLGFEYFQTHQYSEDSHRTISDNIIITKKTNIDKFLDKVYPDNFILYICVVMMSNAFRCNKYLFSEGIPEQMYSYMLSKFSSHKIDLVKLDIDDKNYLIRTKKAEDAKKIYILIDKYLKEIPCLYDKFIEETAKAAITKKFVFDSAHFITDHPKACNNLHGGRYELEITIKDYINPLSGFVLDYSFIKSIVSSLIVNKFDHKTLNYTCPELSWRSSTEFLSIVIWNILIEYIPSLSRIKIYETSSSYCTYKGASLSKKNSSKSQKLVSHYKDMPYNENDNKDKVVKIKKTK